MKKSHLTAYHPEVSEIQEEREKVLGDFPGGPEVEFRAPQQGTLGFDPGQGTKMPPCHMVWPTALKRIKFLKKRERKAPKSFRGGKNTLLQNIRN